MINCKPCESMAAPNPENWRTRGGTLMMKAEYLIVRDDGLLIYCCTYHADQLMQQPGVLTFEKLDKRGVDVPQHDIIVFGPVSEGELTLGGKTYPMGGYAWACSCKASGFGYATEAEAETYAGLHQRD